MESWRWSPLWTSVCPWITQGTTVMPEQLGVSGKLRREVSGGAKDLRSPPSRLITACWWLEMVHPDCRRPGRKQKGPAEMGACRAKTDRHARTGKRERRQNTQEGGRDLLRGVTGHPIPSRKTRWVLSWMHLGLMGQISNNLFPGLPFICSAPIFSSSSPVLPTKDRREKIPRQGLWPGKGKIWDAQCLQPCLYVGRD